MIVRDILITKSTSTGRQFIRYACVGAIAAFADISLLYLLTKYAGIHYLVSAALAFAAGVIINYSLCVIWIFSDIKYRMATGFSLFLIIGIVGLILNEIIIFTLVSYLAMWYMMAKVVSTLIVLFWNFFARKRLVFK